MHDNVEQRLEDAARTLRSQTPPMPSRFTTAVRRRGRARTARVLCAAAIPAALLAWFFIPTPSRPPQPTPAGHRADSAPTLLELSRNPDLILGAPIRLSSSRPHDQPPLSLWLARDPDAIEAILNTN